ncbi:MAG TPA: outer membrane protein assembly factor BamD [Clostridia bacterium]|nr:outer membrane protein assembly factor BamD [Clostridia bacterium]
MSFRSVRFMLILALLLALPFSSPAPLVYRPGEGWTYEPVGSEGRWQRTRAKDQLDVAQAAFEAKDYGLALKAARRVVRVWPLSDYAPQAQYLLARCYQARGRDEKAFKEYQKVLEKYPKTANFQDILKRQVEITDKYLAGKRFRLWGYIPLFPSMEKTADMYTDIVKNGPYSDVAPQSQMKVGAAREKQKNYPLAVKAYELAADRYHDRPQVAADAIYRQGMAYYKQAQKAEYDQSAAGHAIATFTDFMTLFPNDARVAETESIIEQLRIEQARGNFQTAQFYEKSKKWKGALIYYNEVVMKDPNSPYAALARERIGEIKKATETAQK